MGDKPTMPNIQGWALRDVMNLAKTKLNLKPTGTGYVTEQSVPEGTLLQPGTELGVTLVPPLEPQQEAENRNDKREDVLIKYVQAYIGTS